MTWYIKLLLFIVIILIAVVVYQVIGVIRLKKSLKQEIIRDSERDESEETAINGEEGKKRNPVFGYAAVVILISAFFTFFATSIPQVEYRPPEKVEIGADISQTELVNVGEKIFNGRGQCLLCHDIGEGGLRAPDLKGIGARAGKQKPGYSSQEYLYESLLHPNKYVVEGYDPSMPPIDAPPAKLDEKELAAVVSFLQSMGGEVTVQASSKPPYDKIGK